jgi:hypothetical protein
MTTILEIEDAIKRLPINEARKLADWLLDYLDNDWDRQMVADLEGGKLDRLIESAEADIAATQQGLDDFEAGQFQSLESLVQEKRQRWSNAAIAP